MLLYIILAIWPLIVQYMYRYSPLSLGGKRINDNKYLFIALAPIFFVIAFRGETMGADTGTYINHFLRVIDTPLDTVLSTSRMETGYLVFVKIITYITHSALIYQIMCVSIMFYGMYTFLKQLVLEDALLYIYLYCTLGIFFFMFTGTRQCLAMGICLFSYKYLIAKKYWRFLICIILAFCFHKSAILFVGVLFIYNKKVNIYNTIIYCIAAMIIGKNLNNIQLWFNDALDYSYNIEYTGNGMIFLFVLILLTIFSLIMIYNRNNSFIDNSYINTFININFITIICWILRQQTRIAERPSYYFMFFSCVLYANSLNGISNSKERRLYKMLVLGLLMLLYIYRLKTNFSVLIPYDFWW